MGFLVVACSDGTSHSGADASAKVDSSVQDVSAPLDGTSNDGANMDAGDANVRGDANGDAMEASPDASSDGHDERDAEDAHDGSDDASDTSSSDAFDEQSLADAMPADALDDQSLADAMPADAHDEQSLADALDEQAEAPLNGCTRSIAADATPPLADRTVTVQGLAYSPRCLRIAVGQSVTFSGSFSSHPFRGGVVEGGNEVADPSSPITPTSTGTTATFTFPNAGVFPYYCDPHGLFGMSGVVYVE